MKKTWKYLYAALFLFLCLIPSLGLLSGHQEASSENRTLSGLPVLKGEDGWNSRYLQQMGDYFQEHFAFRNELVTANAWIFDNIGGISSADGVITGTDGWLYYKDSLEDFQGTDQLSDRALFDIAHTLSMIQDYTNESGIRFLFAVAPNKNSLYGENMPYYYQIKESEENNFSRLLPFLEKEGVHYVNLHQIFREQEEILYHKRDSHWNNKGAALAADTMMTALGKEHFSYVNASCTIRKDFTGDLDQMLYPAAMTPEEEYYYDPEPSFTYVGDVTSNFGPHIQTEGAGQGSLVMYRDSFCNALLPFFSEAYGNAFYSRGIPYQLSNLTQYQADTLIIERAERFLPDTAANPPVMDAPLAEPCVSDILPDNTVSEVALETTGMYTKISGILDSSCLETSSRILVKTSDTAMYEAFPVHTKNDQEGFILYLPASETASLSSGQLTFFLSE